MERENPFVKIYRKCNNGDNEAKYDLIKTGIVTVPRYIDIELTNYCNMKCRMCPTGTNMLGIARGYMSEETIDAICVNLSKYRIKGVRLIGWGEPTIHRDFWRIIRKLKV